MKHPFWAIAAIAACTLAQSRADNFVTITPTGAAAATVTNRWIIGSGLSGLGYIDGNSGFPGATATNFFTLTGNAIPALGDPTGFTSYLPTGAATAQGSVGNSLTPNSYSGLTYVAENLGLIGPLSFYAIHHRGTGDYLALIQPSVPTVSDQKPMSIGGTAVTPGASGYFALSYAVDNPGGWGAQLFYYLRTNGLGETVFGSLIPALISGPTDRWNLGAGRGYTDLAYTTVDIGFGSGPSQFYYLRLDPTTQTSFFGRLNPLTGVATDIQNLGGVYRTLTFTPTNVGYGANQFYSIGRPAQAITFAAIADRTACDPAFTFTLPTASSALPVTLVVTGPATLSAGNTLTMTGGTGTVTLTATQAGNGSFAPAPTVVRTFAVAACPPVPLTAQTITFAAIADRTACDPAFTFTLPTASSGLPVTLVVTGPATLSAGNTLTMTGGTGTVTLTATQAGNGTFSAAPTVDRTFAVAACPPGPLTAQTITFAALADHTACDPVFTFTLPTSSSGLPVTVVVTGPATLSAGNTLTLTGATGTVTLTATQAGNGTFSAAPTVVRTFAVSACAPPPPPPTSTAQAIVFPVIADRSFCDATFTVSPTSSSGLPVTTTVVSGPAVIVGNTVTLTGVGAVTLRATQAGNGTFAAATSVSRTFNVTKCDAVIVLSHLTKVFYGVPFDPLNCVWATTTPAGLNVTFTYNGSPTPPAAVGTFVVVATIDSPNYKGTATGTLVVTADPRVTQTVSFTTPTADRAFGSAPFAVAASSTSGMPTAIRVLSGPATISSSNMVTLNGPGVVVLEASQAGDIATTFYSSATQSFSVSAAIAGMTLTALNHTFDGVFKDAVAVTSPLGLPVTYTYNGSASAPSAAGYYAVRATVNSPGFSGTVDGTMRIAPAALTQTAAPGSATLSVAPTNGGTYQWTKDGTGLAGATGTTLGVGTISASTAGIYTAVTTVGPAAATSQAVIVGPTSTAKVTGSATEVGTNIVHANGNIYDQVLLQGSSASVTADSGQTVRLSFVDLSNDIVQVEFSGAGTLALNLANATGPAIATNYNQPGVTYMKGHAAIVITGANETSHLSVFSVGRVNAVNQALIRNDVTYDGVADLSYVAIASPTGRFGSIRTANASYLAATGFTGVYAPGVQFSGPVFIGDIAAADSATPVLVLGSSNDVRITGGDLAQLNSQPIQVSGVGLLQSTAGSTSAGTLLPARTLLGRLEQNGADVTATLTSSPTN